MVYIAVFICTMLKSTKKLRFKTNKTEMARMRMHFGRSSGETRSSFKDVVIDKLSAWQYIMDSSNTYLSRVSF